MVQHGQSSPGPNRSEIEQAILRMEPAERRRLLDWLADLDADAWDRQIEADAHAGRLDHLAEQARSESESGNTRPL